MPFLILIAWFDAGTGLMAINYNIYPAMNFST